MTSLSSRASQPIAQSNTGDFASIRFFNVGKDNSPCSLRDCQIAPAVLPIASCIFISPVRHKLPYSLGQINARSHRDLGVMRSLARLFAGFADPAASRFAVVVKASQR